jgi:hypothetical protein
VNGAEHMLLREPLDGAGKRLSAQDIDDPASSVSWPAVAAARRFPAIAASRRSQGSRPQHVFGWSGRSDDVALGWRFVTEPALKPRHVVPTAELPTCRSKYSNWNESHSRVQPDAGVVGQRNARERVAESFFAKADE